MDLFDKIKYNYDKIGYIINLITKWQPTGCKTEKDYESSLYEYFHSQLSQIQITKQYAIGRVKADLFIDNEIILELKNNLSSRGNYQRLIGQLTEYKSWHGRIIILLIGITDQNFIKELKNFIKNEGYSIIEGAKYTLVEKK